MRFLAVLVLIVVAAGGGYYVASTQSRTAVQNVKTVTAKRGSITVGVDLTGSVTAKLVRGLTFGTAGTVAALTFAEGDHVKAQDVIAQLDTKAIDAQMAAAQSALTSAKSALSAARAARDTAASPRPSAPPGTGVGITVTEPSESELAANVDAAQAAVDAASAQIELARVAQSGATVVSPIDGTLTRLAFHVGDYVTPGLMLSATEFPIEVNDLANLQIVAGASEDDVVQLADGQAATVTFDALPEKSMTAQVCAIAVSPTSIQGVPTYPITLCPAAVDPAIRLGLTAAVRIEVAHRENVLLVASNAIRVSGDTHQVTFVTPDNRLIDESVEVGESDGTNTEIVSGLVEGDRVEVAN